MFREMKLRLWKARGVKEWVFRFIQRYIVPLIIAVTLSIALFAAAYERLTGGQELNPGWGQTCYAMKRLIKQRASFSNKIFCLDNCWNHCIFL